jgi:hypothetical protein
MGVNKILDAMYRLNQGTALDRGTCNLVNTHGIHIPRSETVDDISLPLFEDPYWSPSHSFDENTTKDYTSCTVYFLFDNNPTYLYIQPQGDV